jgi:hypothetical protein
MSEGTARAELAFCATSERHAGESLASRFTKAAASERPGCGRPWLLLPVGDSPERQSVAELSAGDKAEARHRRRTPVSLGHRRPRCGRLLLGDTSSECNPGKRLLHV